MLALIGGALLVGNLSGAPASTSMSAVSMSAVGAIAGLGLAAGGSFLTFLVLARLGFV